MQFIKKILDVIYTPKCIACGRRAGKSHVCHECYGDINLLCVDSYSQIKRHFSLLWTLAAYEGAWMEIIHNFKYGRGRASHKVIFSMLKNNLTSLDHIDCIVPVPQHYRRYLLRGYNQSAVVANMVSKIIDRPAYLRALSKLVNTPPQVGKTLRERTDNLAGAFSRPRLLAQPVMGKNVLLVDDVVTSGSTIDECAGALRKAGAKRVDVLTLAKVL